MLVKLSSSYTRSRLGKIAPSQHFTDGRKPFPINHGATTPDTFLQVGYTMYRKICSEYNYRLSMQDAAKVCQNFMARDPTELHFTVAALAAAQ